jgi:hypothetical protein
MKPDRKSKKLESQLENRRRNLEVVKETIRSDPASESTLGSVKVFLSERIESMEHELNRN